MILIGSAILTALIFFMYFGTGAFRVFSTLLWACLGSVVGGLLGGASHSPFFTWAIAILMGFIFGWATWNGQHVSRFLCGGLIPAIAGAFLIPNAISEGHVFTLYLILFLCGGFAALKWSKAFQASMTPVLGFALLLVLNGGGLVAGT